MTAGGDPTLRPIVSFHPRRDVPGIERHRDKPWMRKPIGQAGYRWIAVTTEKNDWYQHSDMDDAVQAINRYLNGVRPLTFGFSMGGLAAWQYADALNALGWVGVSPTYDTRPSNTYDKRVMEDRLAVQKDCGWRDLLTVPTGGHVIFDPAKKSSALQVQDLAENATITLHPYPNSGHACLLNFAREKRLTERLKYHFNSADRTLFAK